VVEQRAKRAISRDHTKGKPFTHSVVEPVVSTGVLVLLVAVGAALVFGALRALTDGRFRGTHRVHGAESTDASPAAADATPESLLEGTRWADDLGEHATLLQFSSAFCAPCRATRRTLGDVAATSPGVAHIEIDAEHHLDVVRRLGILRTPTTIVLGEHGQEIARATGAPTKQQVLAAISRLAPDA
jgi:thiol-disulfide isomerase/thioredoxin